ncbi:flavodoxin [Caulobacter endophyticus]|uniref:flavodoxin n=1 Tax=Caulobacter endophyticus TaxID=2172652 RepID=UPI00240EE895|nr:flavodoxin [Caulobacter endophyticus]MDG2527301.1 flavodoxin [Caulobacter endophyticus]
MSRRAALSVPAALALAAGASACSAHDRPAPAGASSTLVAYFTRSGNTRVIAVQLHRELKADLFEIQAATPYPEDYEQTVEQARQERDAGVRPLLKATVPNLSGYDTVFLCFPIWGETAPPIIRSFLAAHDLSGKTIRPVITHGGYGLGDSLAVLRRHAPSARLEPAFSMEADQERRTMTQVREWLGAIARA